MSSQVLVHLDLSPESHRAAFNKALQSLKWQKVHDVFTSWTATYTDDDTHLVRADAINEFRAVARQVGVKFSAIIMVGNTSPTVFSSVAPKLYVSLSR